MAEYLNDIKADAIQVGLLIGGTSVPHIHQHTPLDGDIAICMYGDKNMEHDSNILKYRIALENAGKDIVNTETITHKVAKIYDPVSLVASSDGKFDFTGHVVVGKNLNSDNPTWCPIATRDDIPIITIDTTINYYSYPYDYTYNSEVIHVPRKYIPKDIFVSDYYYYSYHYHDVPSYSRVGTSSVFDYHYYYSSVAWESIERSVSHVYPDPIVASTHSLIRSQIECGSDTHKFALTGYWRGETPAYREDTWVDVIPLLVEPES